MMGPDRLGHLLDRHAAALELLARQWCAVPEDVVQDSFLKLSQQPTEPVQVVAWLYRVVRNGAISAGRSARRRVRYETLAAIRSPWFVEDSGARVDAAVLTARLASLAVEQREVIIAHLWGGLTFEQIADLTHTSTATAHRRYVAGLTELRARLNVPCPQNRKI
jgi:RNA polymerase sigma-70 factor (ECF subfamily)